MSFLKAKTKSETVPAGKPKEQALAIAYSVQRQAAKKRMSASGIVQAPQEASDHPKSIVEAVMRKRRLAKGGLVEEQDAKHGVPDNEVENYDGVELESVVDDEAPKSRVDRARAKMKARGAA